MKLWEKRRAPSESEKNNFRVRRRGCEQKRAGDFRVRLLHGSAGACLRAARCRGCCQTTTGASGMDKLLLYHSTTSLSTSRCAWCAGSPNHSNHSHLAGTNATEALRPRSSPEAQLWRIQPCDLAQLRVRVGKCRTRMHIPSKNVRQRYLSHSSSAFAR